MALVSERVDLPTDPGIVSAFAAAAITGLFSVTMWLTSPIELGGTSAALGIVMMSLSDVGAAAASWSAFGASFQDAVNNRVGALIDAWQTANPGKPLVFFGPTWNAESPALDIYRIRDAVLHRLEAELDLEELRLLRLLEP